MRENLKIKIPPQSLPLQLCVCGDFDRFGIGVLDFFQKETP